MKLAVQARTLTGKKVVDLRKAGQVPGVIYGRHLDQPLVVSFDKIQLVKTLKSAGKSTPVELSGDSIDQLILFHDYQLDPVGDRLMHVDCLAVNKDEKVTAEVPLILTGESPFEKDSLGRVQQLKNSVLVEALPLDLPHDITIDISVLTEDGQVLHVSDLPVSEKVTILDELTLAVAIASAFREEEEEEEIVPVEGEEGAEGEEGTGEEGEGDEEGDKKEKKE